MKFQCLLPFLFFLFVWASVQAQSSRATAEKHLLGAAKEYQLSAVDLADWIITDEHVSSSSGIHHIYVRQRYQGIEIFSANGSVHLLKNGELLLLNNAFVSQLNSKITSSTPTLSAIEAVEAAAKQLGYKLTEPLQILEQPKGKAQKTLLSKGGISLEHIPAKLVYQPTKDGQLKLAWDLSIYETGAQNWWQLRVDALTGKILDRNNWVEHCSFDHLGSTPTSSAKPDMPGSSPGQDLFSGSGPTYNVFPEPVESPSHGSRALKTNPSDPMASPFGWHDEDGVPGPEYTITRGNNVHAYHDIFNRNSSIGDEPDGGSSLHFDFPLDLSTNQPYTQIDPLVTNLFYWNNLIHDVWHHYGFDEAAGNFQSTNYTGLGVGGDYVRAEALDGSGTNNANFATPPDGTPPRMQMYLWGGVLPVLNSQMTVTDGGGNMVAYSFVQAGFGGELPEASNPLTGELVLVEDESAPTTDACENLINGSALAGKIAVIDRGSCQFGFKILSAENAGAIGAVVCNNVAGAPTLMTPGAVGDQVTIPAVMISLDDCSVLKGLLPGAMASLASNLTVPNPGPTGLSSDLDNGVIIHEYVHGLSNRLTGGASNSGCLSNQEQMGEGWSDWYGLMLTMDANDIGTERRGIGTYLLGQPTTGTGIRPYPYSTDMAINPHTYNSIQTASIPHGVGSIWAAMLWEMTWSLIDRYGFDSDFHNGSGGNNIALQLVTEALKIQPCNPGFVDGRDAILAADAALYNGVHRCLIWAAFAKRGLGFSATQGSSGSRADGTQAFDVPADVSTPCSTASDFLLKVAPLENKVCAATGTAQFEIKALPAYGYSNTLNLSVSDLPAGVSAAFSTNPVTGLPATITLTLSNLTTLPPGSYNFSLTGTDGTLTNTVHPALGIIDASPSPPALQAPADAQITLNSTPLLSWGAVADAISYDIQIATDAAFNGIVQSETISGERYPSSLLPPGTYYWRVRTTTPCGTGPFSTGNAFTIQSCGQTFTDSGGSGAPHSNNENLTYTICPDQPGGAVQVRFTAFDLEPNGAGCFDFMQAYDGNSAAGTFLGQFCGTGVDRAPGGGLVKATTPSGCLTFVFSSDPLVEQQGWEAIVNCDFLLDAATIEQNVCAGQTAEVKVWASATTNLANPVHLSATELPDGVTAAFSPATLTSSSDTALLTLTLPGSLPVGTYDVTINGTDNTVTRSATAGVEVIPITPATLVAPADAVTTINSTPLFSWNAVPNAVDYTLEIASDMAFSNIIQSVTTPLTKGTPQALPSGQAFYWRVATNFDCDNSISNTRSITIQGSCSGTFADSGGSGAPYSNSENITYTICPDNPGYAVQIQFTAFDVEPISSGGCYDFMQAYDGSSTAGTFLGQFCGTGVDNAPGGGVVTATTLAGCLTFVFSSDGTVVREGWEATTSCVSQPEPTISISDGAIEEGDAGTTNLNLLVSLSNPYPSNVTVNYSTANNVATTQDNDYQAVQSSLSFQPGEATKMISISVNGDTLTEIDETLFINLNSATNGLISDSQGIATIQNDDGCDPAPPSVGLDFDGVDDYIEVPDADELSLLEDFTFEVWVKVTDFNNWNGIIAKAVDNLPAPFDYYLFSSSGLPNLLVGNGSIIQSVTATNPPVPGAWTHLAVVKDGTSVTHYLNGVSNGSGEITTASGDNNSSMIIGSRADLFTKMKGSMDELRIWNMARTQGEIQDNLYQELSGSESELVAYYPFNEGTANGDNTAITTIEDRSGFGNNGVPANFSQTSGTSNWIPGTPIIELDSDSDGFGDSCDICQGNDATGDHDMDGICNDIDPDYIADECDGDIITIPAIQYNSGAVSTTVRASQTITTNGSVVALQGATVSYTAGETITLTPGFHAQPNSTFTARIATCTPTPSRPMVETRSNEAPPAIRKILSLTVFPNPTNGFTTIQYTLPETGPVHLSIYDLQGRMIQSFTPPTAQIPGTHQVEWDASSTPGGLYLVRMQTANSSKVEKLMISGGW